MGTALLVLVMLLVFSPILRREFFPEADAGAFEIYVRGASGTRIEVTEERIAEVEKFIREKLGHDSGRDHQRTGRHAPTGPRPIRPTPAPWTPWSKCN